MGGRRSFFFGTAAAVFLTPCFFILANEKPAANLEIVRVPSTFFYVRLFSKFEEREIEIVDENKTVTRVFLVDSGGLKISGPKGEHTVNENKGWEFPNGVHHVTPRAHGGYGRHYRGALTIRCQKRGAGGKSPRLEIILQVAEEDYTASVLASERVPGSGLEAQKALAVCVRSFARYRVQTENKTIFSDLTEDQVFKGLDVIDAVSLRAAAETAGLILSAKEEGFLPAYYSSTCGTMTTTPKSVWKGDAFDRYFGAVTNVLPGSGGSEWLDLDSPHFHWTFRLPQSTVREIFSGEDGKPVWENKNSKVHSVRVGRNQISGWDFRQAVCLRHGWASMKSLECRIHVLPNGDWEMSGSGLGHGVGMSVYGSAKLAERGYGYREILKFYFPLLILK